RRIVIPVHYNTRAVSSKSIFRSPSDQLPLVHPTGAAIQQSVITGTRAKTNRQEKEEGDATLEESPRCSQDQDPPLECAETIRLRLPTDLTPAHVVVKVHLSLGLAPRGLRQNNHTK